MALLVNVVPGKACGKTLIPDETMLLWSVDEIGAEFMLSSEVETVAENDDVTNVATEALEVCDDGV